MILFSILVLGLLGFIFGVLLAYSARKFVVHVDPIIEELLKILPGLNCGACGFAGCSGYATEIAKGADIHKCPVGGHQVSEKIAKLLGKEVISQQKMVAVLKCQGNKANCIDKYDYNGIVDCQTVALVYNGNKACDYACLGLGNCARVCPVSAIYIKDGLPVIDRNICVSCGFCVKECPRHVLTLVAYNKDFHVSCSSHDKAQDTRKICKVGCIACGLCVKNCPVNAIELKNNLAQINYDTCTNCGICSSKCPTKTITNLKKQKENLILQVEKEQ